EVIAARPTGRECRGRAGETHIRRIARAEQRILRRRQGERGQRRSGADRETARLVHDGESGDRDGTGDVGHRHPERDGLHGGGGVPQTEGNSGTSFDRYSNAGRSRIADENATERSLIVVFAEG